MNTPIRIPATLPETDDPLLSAAIGEPDTAGAVTTAVTVVVPDPLPDGEVELPPVMLEFACDCLVHYELRQVEGVAQVLYLDLVRLCLVQTRRDILHLCERRPT